MTGGGNAVLDREGSSWKAVPLVSPNSHLEEQVSYPSAEDTISVF